MDAKIRDQMAKVKALRDHPSTDENTRANAASLYDRLLEKHGDPAQDRRPFPFINVAATPRTKGAHWSRAAASEQLKDWMDAIREQHSRAFTSASPQTDYQRWLRDRSIAASIELRHTHPTWGIARTADGWMVKTNSRQRQGMTDREMVDFAVSLGWECG